MSPTVLIVIILNQLYAVLALLISISTIAIQHVTVMILYRFINIYLACYGASLYSYLY
jgi:hypothetical protein